MHVYRFCSQEVKLQLETQEDFTIDYDLLIGADGGRLHLDRGWPRSMDIVLSRTNGEKEF